MTKRTVARSISLDIDLDRKLEEYSRKTYRTVSATVQMAIDHYFSTVAREQAPAHDRP